MRIKHDVDLRGIQPQMAMAAAVAESVYRAAGSEMTVTSGVEGAHMEGSLHYKGLALDLRLPTSGAGTIKAALADALGPQFDVVVERDHVHIEFDPKIHT